MLLIDVELAALAVSPFLLAIFVQLHYGHVIREATAAAEQERGEVAATATDNIHAARLVMSLGRQAEQREAFDRTVRALFRGWVQVGKLDAIYGPVLSALPYVGLALVLGVGGRAVVDGQISRGEFVTFYGYSGILAGVAASSATSRTSARAPRARRAGSSSCSTRPRRPAPPLRRRTRLRPPTSG
jgi:ABC-type multidrug transport system fused ATPase/permease subunit